MNLCARAFGALLLAPVLAMAASPETENNPAIQNAASGEGSNASPACPDAEIFGRKLITGICWDCMFPISIAGGVVKMGDTEAQKPPEDANEDKTCSCPKSIEDPIPTFGLSVAFWEPARLIEAVRAPFCSPTLAGTKLKDTWRGMGHRSKAGDGPTNSGAYYNMHYMAFPLMAMLDMLFDASCNPDGYMDFDLMYMTEFDPSWINDELALAVNFETVLFANPAAIAACAVDATAATAGYPLKHMWWCAGAWGTVYPMTGNVNQLTSPPRTTSLLSTRLLAKLHRMGLARKTTGSETLCRAPFHPTLHKTQYKMSTLHPVVEAESNHWIGQHTFVWGEWRNIPAVGEDFVYMLYRYNDCCFRML